MEKWQKVLNKFLERFKGDDLYEGALACGSYVSGNYNEFSDIDVHIVTKRGVDWRERGNLEIDGILVEYFINPVNKYEVYMEEEMIERGNHTTKMFARGLIVEDLNGEVLKLQDRAKELENIELPEISEFDLLASMYGCWDNIDELKVCYHEKRDTFYLVYYELYKRLLTLHGKVKKLREFPLFKIDKVLDNETFRNNYGISKFYDEYDTCLIRECLICESREVMLKKITKFYNYVMECCGGFDINKFVLRSEVK